jgi:hypothetical protein
MVRLFFAHALINNIPLSNGQFFPLPLGEGSNGGMIAFVPQATCPAVA